MKCVCSVQKVAPAQINVKYRFLRGRIHCTMLKDSVKKVCVYVCVCMCICMFVCMYVCMYVCGHLCMYVYVYVYVYMCLCTFKYYFSNLHPYPTHQISRGSSSQKVLDLVMC